MNKIILFLALLISFDVSAEINAIPMPGDTKMVVFEYDPNDTYTIITRPQAITDIQLNADESMVAFALGDTIQWKAETADNHIFLKPLNPDIFTSATLVTNKRSYQMTLRSSPMNGKWYQKVSWEVPSLVALKKVEAAKTDAAAIELKIEKIADHLDDGMVSLDNLNFGYKITGNSEFKPLQVMDDGRFTWIKMPSNIQELPALFLKNEKDNSLEYVNFTVKRDSIIVHRTANVFVMKIGPDQIKIERSGDRNRGVKGWLNP